MPDQNVGTGTPAPRRDPGLVDDIVERMNASSRQHLLTHLLNAELQYPIDNQRF